jgi:hypothetical protein
VAELRDAAEVTGAAVSSLEATLSRIERAEYMVSDRSGGGPPDAPAQRRRSSQSVADSGGADSDAAAGRRGSQAPTPTTLAAVSRELVRSQLAAADLQRKLRVAARWGGDEGLGCLGSRAPLRWRPPAGCCPGCRPCPQNPRWPGPTPCRCEVDLRQKLAQRDARIGELKQEAAARARAMADLQRHARGARGGPAAAAAQAARRHVFEPSGSASAGLAAAGADPAMAPQPAAAAGGGYSAQQAVALRAQLARRDADIQRLEGARLLGGPSTCMPWSLANL